MSTCQPKTIPAPPNEKLKDADWVNNMRDHFTRSGSYRVEDIRRILGDPNQHADVTVERDKKTGSRILTF